MWVIIIVSLQFPQIKSVIQACCQFLEKQIEVENVIGISDYANQNGCSDLHATTLAFMNKNFEQVN